MYRLVKKYVGLFIALIVVFILTVAILHIKKISTKKTTYRRWQPNILIILFLSDMNRQQL